MNLLRLDFDFAEWSNGSGMSNATPMKHTIYPHSLSQFRRNAKHVRNIAPNPGRIDAIFFGLLLHSLLIISVQHALNVNVLVHYCGLNSVKYLLC